MEPLDRSLNGCSGRPLASALRLSARTVAFCEATWAVAGKRSPSFTMALSPMAKTLSMGRPSSPMTRKKSSVWRLRPEQR